LDAIDQTLARLLPNEAIVLLVFSLILLAAAEIGFFFATRHRRATPERRASEVGGLQAAFLGLLALLLGFTFSMALGRFDSRRNLVLQEANAIGTTYLRASFLPASDQAAVEKMLRRYIDLRLPLYDANTSPIRLASLEAQCAQLQHQLWSHAVTASRQSPTPLAMAFVSALNELIDLDASRVHALQSHVPGAAWLLLLVVSVVGCYISGYAAGLAGTRSAFSTVLLPVLIAVVITLISDLDAPRRGIIGVSKQPLLDLCQSLQSPSH
jgi:hypothetical protein